MLKPSANEGQNSRPIAEAALEASRNSDERQHASVTDATGNGSAGAIDHNPRSGSDDGEWVESGVLRAEVLGADMTVERLKRLDGEFAPGRCSGGCHPARANQAAISLPISAQRGAGFLTCPTTQKSAAMRAVRASCEVKR